MTNNSTIFIPTVSKSLLIVLGTSPKSALFWAMESAALWKTKARFPQGLDNKSVLTTLPTTPVTVALFSLASEPLGAKKVLSSFAGKTAVAPCVMRPCKAGVPSHPQRNHSPLLTPAYVRRCSSRPLRSGVRSLKEFLCAKMLTIESGTGSK